MLQVFHDLTPVQLAGAFFGNYILDSLKGVMYYLGMEDTSMANGHTKTQLVPVKDSTHPFVQKALFEKALKRFFIGGFDQAQHTTADSLAWSMQFELDLWEEGEDGCELKTKRDVNRARKFVQDFGKSEWVATLKKSAQ